MLRSMTGFGAGRSEDGVRIVSIEARSVNHRYLDVRVHLPAELIRLTTPAEAAVKQRFSRGRVDVGIQIGLAPDRAAALAVDVDKARAYQDAYRRLAEGLGVADEVPLKTIAGLPGVMSAPDATGDVTFEHVGPALEQALDAVHAMRAAEGSALALELSGHLANVDGMVARIRDALPDAIADRRARLDKRLAELLGDASIDPMRLAQEVAVLVDRSDVTEEIERLDSHTSQFAELLKAEEPIGRRLDFLIQEMNREANTIGSKCSNTTVAYVVVDLKSELERMREQAQNVE